MELSFFMLWLMEFPDDVMAHFLKDILLKLKCVQVDRELLTHPTV